MCSGFTSTRSSLPTLTNFGPRPLWSKWISVQGPQGPVDPISQKLSWKRIEIVIIRKLFDLEPSVTYRSMKMTGPTQHCLKHLKALKVTKPSWRLLSVNWLIHIVVNFKQSVNKTTRTFFLTYICNTWPSTFKKPELFHLSTKDVDSFSFRFTVKCTP